MCFLNHVHLSSLPQPPQRSGRPPERRDRCRHHHLQAGRHGLHHVDLLLQAPGDEPQVRHRPRPALAVKHRGGFHQPSGCSQRTVRSAQRSALQHLHRVDGRPSQNIPACWHLHGCQPAFTIQTLTRGEGILYGLTCPDRDRGLPASLWAFPAPLRPPPAPAFSQQPFKAFIIRLLIRRHLLFRDPWSLLFLPLLRSTLPQRVLL